MTASKAAEAHEKLLAWGRECVRAHKAKGWAPDKPSQDAKAYDALERRIIDALHKVTLIRDRRDALIRAGIREAEARAAAINEETAHRARSLAEVRANWRTMMKWPSGARGLRRLHFDALALLQRITKAQTKAADLRLMREIADQRTCWEREAQEQREAEARRQRKAAQFLSQGTWSALDNLKL